MHGWTSAAAVATRPFLPGLAFGMLWPSQGKILTDYAPAQLLNWYASIFSLVFFSSAFLGPAVVSLVTKVASSGLALATLCGFAGLGVLFLSCLPLPEVSAVATGKTVLEGSEEEQGLGIKLLQDRSAQHLCALALCEGLCLNALGSTVFPLLACWGPCESADVSFQEHLQFVMLFTGLGHVLAALVYAPLAQCLGRRFVLILQAVMLMLAVSFIGDSVYFRLVKQSVILTALCGCAASFLLGFGVILAR